MRKIKIGYFGDGKWAHSSFKKLLNDKSIDISFLCLRNKKPDLYLYKLAKKKKIDVFNPKNINSSSFIKNKNLKEVNLFVSMSYNQIFKKQLISMPDLGIINCHAGNLPFYRGRNPLNWVLINGEKKFGITVHYIDDEKIDSGDIILKKIFPIKKSDTYGTLLKKSHNECSKILLKSIKKIQLNNVKRIKQSNIDKKGSYFKKRISGDERINWNWGATKIFNFIRALNPDPLAYSYLNLYKHKVYIKEVSNEFKKKIGRVKPGTIVKVTSKYFNVSSNDKIIKVINWKSDSKLNEKQILN